MTYVSERDCIVVAHLASYVTALGADPAVSVNATCARLQEDVRSIEAGLIPTPKYANSQAAFYAVQQAPPPMPMPPPIPIETSATVSNCACCFVADDVILTLGGSSKSNMLFECSYMMWLSLSAGLVCAS